VPLITFGENCFYRALSEPILAANNIDYAVAFSVPSTAGVYSAIEAGLGVGVIGSRELCGDIVEWARGAALPPLPVVHQIARTVPGESPDVAAVLRDAIVAELTEPDPRLLSVPTG
jgi:DNA-binding transcriptional LysR family regulator